jgi:hypothetical protein
MSAGRLDVVEYRRRNLFVLLGGFADSIVFVSGRGEVHTAVPGV